MIKGISAYAKTYKNYICLTIIYIMTNFLLLIVSGRWWDDWTIHFMSFEEMMNTYRQAGSVIGSFLLYPVKGIPFGGYRILVFLWHYLSSLIVFRIITSIDIFREKDALWCTILYITAPINDARITLITYGYTLLLCFFWMGFYLLIVSGKEYGRKGIVIRILADILLVTSYWVESLLVFTGVIWIYLFYDSIQKSKETETIFRKLFICLRKNIDIFVLPFAFFIVKNLFFTPNGRYEGYNAISMESIIDVMKHFIQILEGTLSNLFENYKAIQYGKIFWIVFGLYTGGVLLYSVLEKNKDYNVRNERKNVFLILLGWVCLFAGLFPYIVIRQAPIYFKGVMGRDSLLLGLGIALIGYYNVKLFIKDGIASRICLGIIMISGMLYMNKMYILYQQDWYMQLSLREEISTNQYIKDNDTFLCIFDNWPPSGGTGFYTVNGIGREATGEQTRLFMCGIGQLSLGINYNKWLLHGYNMNDYDQVDTKIDGVIFINNRDISFRETLTLRLVELFDKDGLKKKLNISDITYVPIDIWESDLIYNSYLDGSLDIAMIEEICFTGK